jgi:hypothetical protein
LICCGPEQQIAHAPGARGLAWQLGQRNETALQARFGPLEHVPGFAEER